MRRRVWCETLTFDEVSEPTLLAALRARQLELVLAVRPAQLAALAGVVGRVEAAGVALALWPMLDDADGRWASAASAARYVAFADAVLAAVPGGRELVVDLEPPLARLEAWRRGRPWAAGGARDEFAVGRAALSAAVARWTRERRVTTAVMPMLVAEVAGQWMQRLFGTPVTGLAVDRHSVMAYTSLYEGWSRGWIGRRRAEALLVATARLARRRFGPRAAVSVGCVGTGAFGDEPTYRDARELARDVALVRGAGIDEVAAFDLGGMVRRGPLAPWLDALWA